MKKKFSIISIIALMLMVASTATAGGYYTGEWRHGGSTYLSEQTEGCRWQGGSDYGGIVTFDVDEKPIYLEMGGDGHSKTEYRPADNPQAPVKLIYTESCGKAHVWKMDNKP